MIPKTVDVAILGSGFAGSLTALILDRIGLSVVLLERHGHPRFAIGESSTPAADFILADLAEKYGLHALRPLTAYGTWRSQLPQLVCGLKRGFSYFKHTSGQPFDPLPEHRHELLVAASATDADSDTHWLRSDVDAFICEQVLSAGIPYADRVQVWPSRTSTGWTLEGQRSEGSFTCRARFVVDATGSRGLLPEILKIANRSQSCLTHSRALFGHFRDVIPWRDILGPEACVEHPFGCDNGALHHILDCGWMWQLRFDNGVTSAGFCLDTTRCPSSSGSSPQSEWDQLLDLHPTIARQFADARCIAPENGITRTARLQRRWDRLAGSNWALLPHTAGFIDPLHSTGIAHALLGVERLTQILESHWEQADLSERLDAYGQSLSGELDLVDRLVHSCYCCMPHFDLFVPCSMLYFASTIAWERRRISQARPQPDFLCADDNRLNAAITASVEQLQIALSDLQDATRDAATIVDRFQNTIRTAIAPFNAAGLCRPEAQNLYHHTAAPRKRERRISHSPRRASNPHNC